MAASTSAASAAGLGVFAAVSRSARAGQRQRQGGAVAVRWRCGGGGAAAGQESTPTARLLPLYRLYCALSLEFWAIPLILRFQKKLWSTRARPHADIARTAQTFGLLR